jgi:hypothetical protein
MKKLDQQKLLESLIELSAKLRDSERDNAAKDKIIAAIREDRKRPHIAVFTNEQLVNLAHFLAISVSQLLEMQKKEYVN